MIARTINQPILEAAAQMSFVSLTGPRQSGKTTLVQSVFSDYKYVSLEDPEIRLFAIEDAKGFLESYGHHLIIEIEQFKPAENPLEIPCPAFPLKNPSLFC